MKLVAVLGDHAEHLTVGVQSVDRCIRRGEVGVRGSRMPEQGAAIQEDQSWASSSESPEQTGYQTISSVAGSQRTVLWRR